MSCEPSFTSTSSVLITRSSPNWYIRPAKIARTPRSRPISRASTSRPRNRTTVLQAITRSSESRDRLMIKLGYAFGQVGGVRVAARREERQHGQRRAARAASLKRDGPGRWSSSQNLSSPNPSTVSAARRPRPDSTRRSVPDRRRVAAFLCNTFRSANMAWRVDIARRGS